MIFLMYHELETAHRPLCQAEPGYVRYVVRRVDFRAQLQALKDGGWNGLCVSDALKFPPSAVAITFDDGCETDILTATPILRELAFGATFYITAGFVDKPGYLSSNQLGELTSSGFEVGCHAMTHTYLSGLDEKDMHREVVQSRQLLQQKTGQQVEHFSFPGGRYDRHSIQSVKNAGYRTAATSRIHANFPETDLFSLGRVAVMRSTQLSDFEALCKGDGLRQLSFHESLRRVTKRALGNELYDRLRSALLKDSAGNQ